MQSQVLKESYFGIMVSPDGRFFRDGKEKKVVYATNILGKRATAKLTIMIDGKVHYWQAAKLVAKAYLADYEDGCNIMDIDYSNTLNKMNARSEKDEKHICPLQLDTIKRAVSLWSNEGDVVLTPFMGIGSEVYQSILCGRKGIGFELKESYFNEAVKNIQEAEFESNQKVLLQF